MKRDVTIWVERVAITVSLVFLALTNVSHAADRRDISACRRALTVEEFRAVAFEKSPLVAEIDSEYVRQAAQAFEVEVLGNPEIQAEQVYTSMRIGGADDPQTNASIGQPLRLSNFGSRGRVAALLRKSGDTQKRAKLLELTQKLALQFYTLYMLQRTEALITQAEQRAARQAALIHEGVTKGLLSQGEHKLFEGEKYRLQSQIKGVQASHHMLQAEISKSLGLACLVEAKGDPLVGVIPTEEVLVAKARESDLSELSRVDLLEALSAEQVKLAQLDAFPSVTPRLVYQHTNDGGDFVGVGIAMPLPLFNRNQSATMRSQADQISARRRRDFLNQGGLEEQVRALRSAAVSASEQAELYSKRVVPAFEEALRSQERLYTQGKGSVLQVWQTLRTCNDAQRESLAVWLNAAVSRMQLSLLVGEEV